jgi:hypothetical protein
MVLVNLFGDAILGVRNFHVLSPLLGLTFARRNAGHFFA